MPTIELNEDDIDTGQLDQPEPQEPEQEVVDDPQGAEEPESAPTVITMEGDEEEEPEAAAPPKLVHAIKAVRDRNKELNREARELRAQVAELKKSHTQAIVELGPKPTLESANWDSEKFEADLDAWKERKRQIDSQQEQQKKAIEEQDRAWKQTLAEYDSEKFQLMVKARLDDYEDAEAEWKESFSVEQQGILLHASKKKAPLIYFLGKHPDRAHELSKIKDPIKLVYAIAEMEAKLTVKASTAKPAPDTPIHASGGTPSAVKNDRVLQKLQAEAELTGDWTKYFSTQRAIRQQERRK